MDALVAVECAAAASARQRDQPTERIAGDTMVQRLRSGHRVDLAVQILMLRGTGIFKRQVFRFGPGHPPGCQYPHTHYRISLGA